MIWFDSTARSVVVGCRSCNAREVTLDRGMADRWAADHLERAHPVKAPDSDDGRDRALTASRVRRHRR